MSVVSDSQVGCHLWLLEFGRVRGRDGMEVVKKKKFLTFAHIYLTSVIAKDEAVLELSG